MDTKDFNPREIYQEKFKKYGVSPKSLLWKTKGSAHQRFRQFWAEIDFTEKTVLDIGCGFGELGNFLIKRYEGVKYEGIDIVPEFIKEGKIKYPHLDLEEGNYMKDSINKRYDIVVASGVLNSNYRDENMKYRMDAINKMFEMTTDVLAFNMLGGHPHPDNNAGSNIWYTDSLEILKYCMTLTRRVILRANYHPRDFTIFMYKVKK
jgi:SAM-dependent methyltransferase